MTQLESLKKQLATFQDMRSEAIVIRSNIYSLINGIESWAKSEYVAYNDFIGNINKTIKSKTAEIVRNNNAIVKLTAKAKELNKNTAATELTKIKDSFTSFKEKNAVLEAEIQELDIPLAKIREIEAAINNPKDPKKSKFKQFTVNFFDFISEPLPEFTGEITEEFIFAVELRKFHMEDEQKFKDEFLIAANRAVNLRFDKTQSNPWVNRLDEINAIKAEIESFNVVSIKEPEIEKVDMSELEELLNQMATVSPIVADEQVEKIVPVKVSKKKDKTKVLKGLEELANS